MVPLGGAAVSLTFIVNRVIDGMRSGEMAPVYIAGGIVVAIFILYLVVRPKAVAIVETDRLN